LSMCDAKLPSSDCSKGVEGALELMIDPDAKKVG